MPMPSKEYDSQAKKACDDLRKVAGEAGLPADCLQPIFDNVVPAYVEANHLAGIYQGYHKWSARLIYGLSFFAICVVVIQYMFFHCIHAIVWAEVGAIVLAYLVIWRAGRYSVLKNWLKYRHRAEMLRLLMYTPLLRPPKGREHQLIRGVNLTQQAVKVDPVVTQIYSHSGLNQCEVGSEHNEALARFIREGWINAQAKYHAKSAHRNHVLAHRAHLIINLLLGATVIAAVFHALHYPDWHKAFGWDKRIDPTVLLTLLLPSLVVGVHGYAQTRNWENSTGRSRAIQKRLSMLARMMKDGTSRNQLENIVDIAEEMVVSELTEWYDGTPEGPKHAG